MSLYSSIAVPDEERRPIKRPGFTGLYDEPSTAQVIEAPPVMYEREPPREVNSKPNAALRFAPKRRPQAKHRKQTGNSAAPRLEVTNSFDEFRDYQPESRSPDDRRPQKDEDEWDEEYDPVNPIDYYDYLAIKADDDDAYQEYREARRRRELGIVEERPIGEAVQNEEQPVQETINEPKSSFAKRYMSSLGWKAGQGLGSQTQGRATPLFVQKYKGTAKVIDRHITPALKLQSRVVVFIGLSLSVQEIGDACSAFGTVERIIQRDEKTMVQFVDGLSSIKCHAQGGALFHCDVRFGNDEKFEVCEYAEV